MSKQDIIKTIGHIADQYSLIVYAVGGFVRDHLLKHHVKDIDFVVVGDGPWFARTVAREIDAHNVVIFDRFQTAMVYFNDYQLEFVSARSESYTVDSRKPSVQKADLLTDLSRRDFTINAMALGINRDNFGQMIDPYDGRGDLQRKIIRTPLDPIITFKDDPLRIMRAIRFASKLKFKIDPNVFEAMKSMVPRLTIVSQERITDELLKILKTDKPSVGLQLLEEAGILPLILPEISALKGIEEKDGFLHKDVFEHTLKVVDNIAKVSDKIELRLVALMHDVAKPVTKRFVDGIGWTFHGHDEIGARMIEPIFRRLKLPKTMARYVEQLVRLHLRPINLSDEEVTDSAIRRLAVQAGEYLEDLLVLCRADITSGNPDRARRHRSKFDYVARRTIEVEEKDKLRSFQSPIRGDEIMEICHIAPGPVVGILKKRIEDAILDNEIDNDYSAAHDYLISIKDEVLDQNKHLMK